MVVILDLFGNYGTKKKKKNDIKCYNKIYKKQTNTFTIKRYRNENKLTKFYLEFLSQLVDKHSQNYLFTKMIKVHVNAKQTFDSNIESPVFPTLTEGSHPRPSYTGPAPKIQI